MLLGRLAGVEVAVVDMTSNHLTDSLGVLDRQGYRLVLRAALLLLRLILLQKIRETTGRSIWTRRGQTVLGTVLSGMQSYELGTAIPPGSRCRTRPEWTLRPSTQ